MLTLRGSLGSVLYFDFTEECRGDRVTASKPLTVPLKPVFAESYGFLCPKQYLIFDLSETLPTAATYSIGINMANSYQQMLRQKATPIITPHAETWTPHFSFY